MATEPFRDEGYWLLADEEGVAAADAAVESVRNQRRLRGEPTMSRIEAVWRANDYLRTEKLACVADVESAAPDGVQDLWVLTYRDPDDSVGGYVGRLEVAADRQVREPPAAPGAVSSRAPAPSPRA